MCRSRWSAAKPDGHRRGPPMLKPIVGGTGIGAERLLAGLASISTALPPTRLIETKTDDGFGNGVFHQPAVLVGAAENLHGFIERQN